MDQHFPRKERDFARAQLAADRIRAEGGSATDEVLGCVAEMMRPQFIHNSIKLAADRTIALGASHPENRERFAAIIATEAGSLDGVILAIYLRWWHAANRLTPWHRRAERRAADRLRADLLLLLRWLRRYHSQDIPEIVEALTHAG